VPRSGTNGMVLMCTGIPEEIRQNELYLQSKDMNAHLIRDKVDSAYNNKTTHLIVGALAKTEKFLCGLAAGIPMVDVSYIQHSRDANQWIQEIDQYDIGSQYHPLRSGNKLYVEELAVRQAKKKAGGVFRGWRVVVLIEDSRQQEIYRRLMELGGAKVDRYTLQHLVDLKPSELGQITHIISTPSMMVHEVFRKFIKKNDASEKVPVVAYIYVGDFLTRKVKPPIHLYDIRQQAMIDILTTTEVKDRLEKMGFMKPPNNMLTLSRPPSIVNSNHPSNLMGNSGPSLQESPDNLEDLPNNNEDDDPRMMRHNSLIISCDLPSDYEYDTMVGSSARKRTQQFSSLNEENSKKLKLSSSVNFRPDGCTKDSEDIEILDETPGKTQEEKTKGLLQLKKKAQSFMRASQVRSSTSQSRLDDWVLKSPRVVTMDVSDEPEVICVEDEKQGLSVSKRGSGSKVTDVVEPEESSLDYNACPEKPSRRQRRASGESTVLPVNGGTRNFERDKVVRSKSTGNSNSQSNHFLVKMRSGSIRSSSVRSLKSLSESPLSSLHPLMNSQNSNASQDSFCSDAFSEVSSPVKSLSSLVSDDPGQKLFFCHNLLVQRRNLVHRLDVGHCALPVEAHKHTVTPYPLPSSMCANIWTCLDSEQELKDLDKDVDESWLAALGLLIKVVNKNRFAPVAAMHKIMEEALRDHRDTLVRTTSLSALLHCLAMHPPGPDRPELANYYVELMSRTRPHLDRWEFDSTEPWEFLSGVIESCLGSQADDQGENIEKSGNSLLLRFLTEICYSDMTRYSDYLVTQDSLKCDYRPVLARILFPSESIGWSRRVERLSKLYINGICTNMHEINLSCVRKLVGLAAQLLQLHERSSKDSQSNHKKLEMARSLALQISQTSITSERLWIELYLMQPTWLSALVSREYLAKICNTPLKDDSPALRSLISTFLDTDLVFPEDNPDNEVLLTPTQTSTPVSAMAARKQRGAARNLSLDLSQTKSPSKQVKIKVNSRDKYGETPLHKAAKKGNIIRIKECLNTPGIDINSKDNSGYTPLHEAVNAGKVDAVQLLIQYVPQSHTLDKFFVVSQNLTSPRRKVDRVDLLAVDKEEGMNPVHEAVDNDNLPIAKLLLETVAKEQGRPGSGLASLDTVLDSTTKSGDTIATLAKTDSMRELVKQFSNRYSRMYDKENCLSGPLSISNKELFGVLIDISVTKYIGMNCLPHIYAMYKEVRVSEVLEAYEECISIKLNEKQAKWGPMDLKDGLIVKQFGRRPRFDIFRSESVKSQDIRDYENLVYYKKQFKKFDPLHPALPMLKLLKITK